MPLIECVPNFSEGRDRAVIDALAEAVRSVDGVWLLDVDPGRATHRTVVTFAGEPEPVVEAAVRAARVAVERIDMRRHAGEHPRFGALDVCPLVPVSGITLAECVPHARELGRRLAEEVGLTVFLYEAAATRPERKNLATVRAGEYEGLEQKLRDPAWKPDFGKAAFDPRSGATAVGARQFLVAYNVNLNTTSKRRAMEVATRVREAGHVVREGDVPWGAILEGPDGKPRMRPGRLKAVKGIGWFIEEYGVAQVSMNLTDLSVTAVHEAFDACDEEARERGMRATGSELVGLVPLDAVLDAGRHYLRKQRRSTGVSDAELVKIAVKSMGLDELAPFEPEKKIVEYALAALRGKPRLASLPLQGFVEETASESVAPGGGSVAAAVGALGAALGTMVANLSAHVRDLEPRWEHYSEWAERGKRCHAELLRLVDADTDAFNAVLAANRLPRGTDAERAARDAAIQSATRGAIDAPLRTLEVATEALEVCAAMAREGNPASVSDAGVGALCARTAARSAYLNVRINLPGLADAAAARAYTERGAALLARAEELEAEALAAVESKL